VSLRELERQIDDAAGTQRWIRIDIDTLDQLSSPLAPAELAEQLGKALQIDDVPVAKRLLGLGADPNGMYYGTHTPPLMFVPSGATARLLIEAGAIPDLAQRQRFYTRASSHVGAAQFAETLLKAGGHADDDVDGRGTTRLWYAASKGASASLV
jgi:hypothetical protein